MPKVLLIRPAQAPFEVERASDAIARAFGADTVTTHDAHPMTLVRLARGSRRLIRSADVVHAFDGPALMCAIAGGAGHIVYSPTRWPRANAVAWIRAAMGYRRIDVVCSSDSLRRALVARGVPIERTHLIRPGVAMNTIPTTRDDAIRQRLGLTEDDRVLFAPGDITRGSGHSMAIWGVGIASVIDPRYRLILRGAAAIDADVRSRLLNPSVLVDAASLAPDLSTEQLFAAADAIAFTPGGAIAPLLIAMAMASNRPILATPTEQVCEMIEDRHTAILVADPSPRLLAERIENLFADAQQMRNLAGRARAEAYDAFTESRMLHSLRGVYEGTASGATKTV